MPQPLEDEAVRWASYLTGSRPSPSLVARYVRLHQARLEGASSILSRTAFAFPAALGPLDTGAAWLAPHDPLRQKLLLLAALIETSPEYAERFLPERASLSRLARAGAGALFDFARTAPFGVPLAWALHRYAEWSAR